MSSQGWSTWNGGWGAAHSSGWSGGAAGEGSERWAPRARPGAGRGRAGGRSTWRSAGARAEAEEPEPPALGSVAPAAARAVDAAVLAKLRVEFCPDPGRGRFTATFDAEPPPDCCRAAARAAAGASEGQLGYFGSVNAGGGRFLRVGGTGLNGQFERDLVAAGHRTADFQRVHQELMRLARNKPGVLVAVPPAVLGASSGLAAAFARCGPAGDGGGFVAVDVLREGQRPLHEGNAAMVYCVGPDRRECGAGPAGDATFLAALHEVGVGLAQACLGYNAVGP